MNKAVDGAQTSQAFGGVDMQSNYLNQSDKQPLVSNMLALDDNGL